MSCFKKYNFLCLFLLTFCSIQGDDGTQLPTKEPLEHAGTIQGQQLEIFGQVDNIELSSLYSRLSKELVNKLPYEADINKIVTGKLHLDSAGFYIAFETDANIIGFDFKLRKTSSYANIPNANESGFELLKWNGSTYISVKNSGGNSNIDNTVHFSYNSTSSSLEKYILLFPTYNGLANTLKDDFTITIPLQSVLYQDYPYQESTTKPILIYGTSVTQGASADLPSGIYTTLLSSMMQKEVINLGFSGSAYMYTNIADYISSIPSATFVIDSSLNLRNSSHIPINRIKPNATYMIETYRTANPNTPIIVISQFETGLTGTNGRNPRTNA